MYVKKVVLQPVVPIYVEHLREYFINLPQFYPIFNIGGMKLDLFFFT